MNLREHLSSTQLKAYLRGWLDETSSDSIEQHLAECPACEETLVSLENDCDTLVQHLRNAEPDEHPRTPPRLGLIAESKLPHRFGAYELQSRIGQGGMGSVYQARHLQLNKSFAIKLVQVPEHPGHASRVRFEREVRAAGGLNHSAIVAATDAGQRDEIHFLAMELIEGNDLGKIARSAEPIRVADACEIIRVVADGLAHAHSKGVVHRDIKPSNVMLSRSGDVKILDFGLAQLSKWDDIGVELTTVGQLMGTLDYMAPEQAEHPESVDYRADLYSLGATLFRLLCGRPPLSATPNLSPLAKLRLLANQSPPRADTLRPDLPAELVDLIASLLASNPNDRPGSASHVAEQLRPFCGEHDLVALGNRRVAASMVDQNDPLAEALLADRDIDVPSAQPSQQPTSPRSPGHWRWLAAAALPLLVITGIMISVRYQKGQLVIESEAAVTVNLIQNGKTYDKVKILPGTNQTRLYAGTYEITIDDASDSFSLDKDTIQIERGNVVIARITSEPTASRTPAIASGKGLPSNSISPGLPASNEPLQPGDRIRIVASSESNLNASTTVLADDSIKVRLLGIIDTKGKTIVELERILNDAYSKYYENPDVEVFRDLAELNPSPRLALSPKEESLRARLSALQNEYDTQLAQFGPNHPTVRQVEKQIGLIRREFDTELAASATSSNEPLSDEPLYDGKSYSEWIQLLKLEQSTQGALDAVTAVRRLTDKTNVDQVTQVMLEKLDRLAETQITQLSSDRKELIGWMYSVLAEANSKPRYAEFLLKRLQTGNEAVREQILLFGLSVGGKNLSEKSADHFAGVRTWIEASVFHGNENQDCVDQCGELYLNWYRESGGTADELLHAIAASPRLSVKFWTRCLSSSPYKILVDRCQRHIESVVRDETSNNQEIVAALVLYRAVASSRADPFPEFSDRQAVVESLGGRLQAFLEQTELDYQLVETPPGSLFDITTVHRFPGSSRHDWHNSSISFSVTDENRRTACVLYEILDFIALMGGEPIIESQLRELESRTKVGRNRALALRSEKRLMRVELLWPQLSIDQRRLREQGIAISSSEFNSRDWFDVFAYERATRMLTQIEPNAAEEVKNEQSVTGQH